MRRKILSLLLKTIVVVCSTVGVALSMRNASGMFMSSRSSLLFFTIQSNIWIGAVCLAGIVLLLLKRPVRRWMYLLKYVFTVSITLTGFVYCTMLAPILGSFAWKLNNVLTHVVVPLAAIADFFLYDTDCEYRMRHSLLAAIPPLYYLIFATVGYICAWDFGGGSRYPYFFLNWGSPAGAFGFIPEFPYIGTVYYILFLVFFVIGVGALYIGIMRRIRRRRAR